MKINHNNFKISFNIAKVNLGKTRLNPSVGCVVVKIILLSLQDTLRLMEGHMQNLMRLNLVKL